MNRGVPPTARKARTGEFTPPGVTRDARSKSVCETGASYEYDTTILTCEYDVWYGGTVWAPWTSRRDGSPPCLRNWGVIGMAHTIHGVRGHGDSCGQVFHRKNAGEVTDTMIGLRGGVVLPRKSSRVEICIAVADRARGRTTWVRSLSGGGGTGGDGPRIPRRRTIARPWSSPRRTRPPGAAAWR
ncbi:hypothetical protein GCM10017667_29060 [Streptomyces filamentosus]|uniref:Uncharacterized protein n=1 Tax=Streptomyces filamentosus TaxID=67294 RepID=A0A919BM52_STRFL|nr:hypothetical protein GCM10017667_29060 [Streptomyces filamentosus]